MYEYVGIDKEDEVMVELYEHNQKTYGNICRMYGEGIQRIAVVQPTGSGKSLLMAKMIEDNPGSRFFILSTSHKINDQFKAKLDKEVLKWIKFNIYYNIPNMDGETMKTLQPDYIFLDEMHRALAKEWSKGIKVLLDMYPGAKVLGLSATPIRYLDKCRNVVNELFDGNLACDMSLSQAILDGILPMARYVCGVYSYEKDIESLNKKIERSSNSPEEKKALLKEVKTLKENLDKGRDVPDIFRKYLVGGNGKFVVFLKDIAHLKKMKPTIEKWFDDAGFPVRIYEVHSRNIDKDKEFQTFMEDAEDGMVKLCLSVNMLAEGLHNGINGVIMLRETMSPNYYFQMIGRAFSCGKKMIPLIFDLVANSQFISGTVDNFPNELKGEIKKRKEECEKEGKDYEAGFDVDEFIVMDYFMDVVSGFREIEGRLIGDWENGLKHFDKYVREHEGDVLVPKSYKDEDGFCTGSWVSHRRRDFGNEMLPLDKIAELEKRNFIWDVIKHNFEKNVNDCIKFYKKHGKKPNKESNDYEERRLGIFWNKNLNITNLPKWKKELLEQIPFFFETKKTSSFAKFYNHILIHKKRYGDKEIKKGEVIDGFNLYQSYYNMKSQSSKLTDEQLKQLKDIGIDFTVDKIKEMRNKKLYIAKQAIKEKIIINSINQIYKGINFYTWKRTHLNDFTKEEMELVDKLVPNPGCIRSVKVIDIQTGQIYVYPSIRDASKALHDEFCIVQSDKGGESAIIKRLRGESKNPVYKGRFMFYYATDEEVKKYLEKNKVS